jgi:hypothetical protein
MCPEVPLTKLDLYRLRQKIGRTTIHILVRELDQGACPGLPQSETGKQINLPPPDLPEGQGHALRLAIMKRIALVLIVGLTATVGQADEFDIVDYGIFRSLDPLAQRMSGEPLIRCLT